MNIRTKLIIAFFATSIISMGALGLMAYQGAVAILQQVSTRQVGALAESKRRDLAKVIEGWKVRVQLISRRTELRRSLDEFNASHDEEQIAPIAGYIGDAVRAVEDVSRITVFDAHGHVVTMFGGSASVPPRATPPEDVGREPTLYNTFQRDDGVDVVFFTLLTLGDSVVGSMEVVLNARELVDVASDHAP